MKCSVRGGVCLPYSVDRKRGSATITCVEAQLLPEERDWITEGERPHQRPRTLHCFAILSYLWILKIVHLDFARLTHGFIVLPGPFRILFVMLFV